jgi:hypothetical protein
MPLDLSIVGWKSEPHRVTWDSARAMLYALGVGAGTVPGLDELAFVTENTAGVAQQVLPTFPVVLFMTHTETGTAVLTQGRAVIAGAGR